MPGFTPEEAMALGQVLNACAMAEARRAKRGHCLRCGNPREQHWEHNLCGKVVLRGCPPKVQADYRPMGPSEEGE